MVNYWKKWVINKMWPKKVNNNKVEYFYFLIFWIKNCRQSGLYALFCLKLMLTIYTRYHNAVYSKQRLKNEIHKRIVNKSGSDDFMCNFDAI